MANDYAVKLLIQTKRDLESQLDMCGQDQMNAMDQLTKCQDKFAKYKAKYDSVVSLLNQLGANE